MEIVYRNYKDDEGLIIVGVYTTYMAGELGNGEHMLAGCVVYDDDIKSGAVYDFAKMAKDAHADMVMIDFSNLSEVTNEEFRIVDIALRGLFEGDEYMDSKTYELRWSFIRVPKRLRKGDIL